MGGFCSKRTPRPIQSNNPTHHPAAGSYMCGSESDAGARRVPLVRPERQRTRRLPRHPMTDAADGKGERRVKRPIYPANSPYSALGSRTSRSTPPRAHPRRPRPRAEPWSGRARGPLRVRDAACVRACVVVSRSREYVLPRCVSSCYLATYAFVLAGRAASILHSTQLMHQPVRDVRRDTS